MYKALDTVLGVWQSCGNVNRGSGPWQVMMWLFNPCSIIKMVSAFSFHLKKKKKKKKLQWSKVTYLDKPRSAAPKPTGPGEPTEAPRAGMCNEKSRKEEGCSGSLCKRDFSWKSLLPLEQAVSAPYIDPQFFSLLSFSEMGWRMQNCETGRELIPLP